MMNFIWGGMLLASLCLGMLSGDGSAVADAMVVSAGEAVSLCVQLCGAYMLWMGLMRVAEEAGLVRAISGALRPLLTRLFPASPEAVEPIAMNLAANFLGVGSAATPFGIEAMQRMQARNPAPDTATEDMCLFLCLNASALELLPAQVLALRGAWESADVYAVVLPTFLASIVCALGAALGCALARRIGRRVRGR